MVDRVGRGRKAIPALTICADGDEFSSLGGPEAVRPFFRSVGDEWRAILHLGLAGGIQEIPLSKK
jgi:hypothetical protein